MKHTYKLLIGLTSIALVSAVLYLARKDQTLKKRTQQVADEGYETAYDILYLAIRKGLFGATNNDPQLP